MARWWAARGVIEHHWSEADRLRGGPPAGRGVGVVGRVGAVVCRGRVGKEPSGWVAMTGSAFGDDIHVWGSGSAEMSQLEQWDIVTGVGMTALGVAAGRALETQRPDALITDPYAHSFVEAADAPVPIPTSPQDLETEAWKDDVLWSSMADYLGVRSRFFDRFFAQAAADGIEQVVLLAAGLDARAFRLEWPAGCDLFEVDQPKVLEFKDGVLDARGARPGCRRRTVPVDLRDDWSAALRAAGFDPGRPTAWLAEGLLPYLPADAERNLFERIRELSAPGSRLAVEQVDSDIRTLMDEEDMRHAADQMGVDMSALWHADAKEDPERVLTDLGWTVRSDTAADVAGEYGRRLDNRMFRASDSITFITARR